MFEAVKKCANFVDLEKMLQNEYSIANSGFGKAENEPSKVTFQHFDVPQISKTNYSMLRSVPKGL